jgi:hypothetical protein
MKNITNLFYSRKILHYSSPTLFGKTITTTSDHKRISKVATIIIGEVLIDSTMVATGINEIFIIRRSIERIPVPTILFSK